MNHALKTREWESRESISVTEVHPLLDAVNCIGLPHDYYRHLTTKTFEERKQHYEWITSEIDKIVDPTLRQHEWLGYKGPWSEDIWLQFKDMPFESFGSFIPLFVPWVKMWIHLRPNIEKAEEYYREKRDQILSLLSPDYMYITVSFNDDGIEGMDTPEGTLPRNLFIISGGGKGHIPIFIYMHKYHPKDFPISENYKYDLMFLGTAETHALRPVMIDTYRKALGDRFYSGRGDWRKMFEESRFLLAPRGFGRNSYRLTEILMSGRVPVYVYNDIIWLPYYDSIDWNSFAIISHIRDLNKTLERIRNTPDEEIVAMRKKIASLYDTHIREEAVFEHVKSFLINGFVKSDLRCARYSASRGKYMSDVPM